MSSARYRRDKIIFKTGLGGSFFWTCCQGALQIQFSPHTVSHSYNKTLQDQLHSHYPFYPLACHVTLRRSICRSSRLSNLRNLPVQHCTIQALRTLLHNLAYHRNLRLWVLCVEPSIIRKTLKWCVLRLQHFQSSIWIIWQYCTSHDSQSLGEPLYPDIRSSSPQRPLEASTFEQEKSGLREFGVLCLIRDACGRCRYTPKILHTWSGWRSVVEMGETINQIG